MNVPEILTLFISFAVACILQITLLIPLRKANKKSYNPVNQAFITMQAAVFVLHAVQFSLFILSNNFGLIEPRLGAKLRVSDVAGFLTFVVYAGFLLYLADYKRHYSAPFVLVLFVTIDLYLHSTSRFHIFVLFALPIGIVVYFLRKGWKNKDGKLYAFGLRMIILMVAQFFAYAPVLENAEILAYVSMPIEYLVFNLGTWGLIDKYYFYDKAAEEKIKNSWINKMIAVETASPAPRLKQRLDQERHVRMECPICLKTKKLVLDEHAVNARKKNLKGIVPMAFLADETCEHEFVAWVDQNFKARGIKSTHISPEQLST